MIPRKDKRQFYKKPIPRDLQKRQRLWDLMKEYCNEYDDPFMQEIDYVLTVEVDSKRLSKSANINGIGKIYSIIFDVDFRVVSGDVFWESHPDHKD